MQKIKNTDEPVLGYESRLDEWTKLNACNALYGQGYTIIIVIVLK